MAKNILVISCDFRETRAALIESGIIAELHIERKGRQSSTVGNVYLGKVTRVLPGLQAAFINIGQERAAFLHVEDLIRPDDFDEYLAGGRKLARGETGGATEAVAEDEADEAEAAAEAAPPPDSEQAIPESASDVEPVDSASDIAAEVAEVAAAPALHESPPSSEPSAAEPESPLQRAGEDLEATIAYPNWPLPPIRPSRAKRGKAGAKSKEAAAPVVEEAPPPAPEPPPASGDDLLVSAQRDDDDAEDAAERPSFNSAPTLDELPADEEDDDDDDARDSLPSLPPEPISDAALDAQPAAGAADTDDDDDDDDDLANMPGFTVTEPGEPVPRAPAPARTADRERGGRRRRGRRRGGDREPSPQVAPGASAAPSGDRGGGDRGGRGRSGGSGGGGDRGGQRSSGRDGGRDGGRSSGGRSGQRGGRGGDRGQGMPGRISKSTPIREVVKEGQEIIVQVTKDPIGTKGARCSSHISLPGRYVVYLPTVEHIGISKRIGNDRERARLREAIEAMKPPTGGLIVRTVAEGLTKKGLKQDIGYLVRLWGEIATKRQDARAPDVLSSELDLVLKVARDLFTDDVDEIVIDDKQQYERLCRFVEMFAPDRVKNVKFYDEDEPIFDEYGIEDEIQRALSRKVPLPSGGHLVIDQAEALTAIDVNTGRFVGKGSKDMEETILKTNIEAVNEIAYQLRFRNIGGLIILDLIDMEQHKNREKVRRTLEELLMKDKAKTTLNRISDLGLIEMTRKRTRESLGRLMHEPCFYCDGTGQLQSKETIAYEILREIRRKRGSLPGYAVVVNAHPAVADVLNGAEKNAVADAENRFMRKITVVPRKEYHLEQFDIQGR